MNYSVRISAQAEDDILNIVDFISEYDLPYAIQFASDVPDFISEKLCYLPYKYSKYTEKLPAHLTEFEGSVRKLVFNKKTVIYYMIDEDEKFVIVLHVKPAKKPLEIIK